MQVKKKILMILLIGQLLCLQSCSFDNDKIKISPLEHFSRGNVYYQNNDPKMAIDEYKMAIQLDPNREEFYNNLGLAYYKLIMYEDAIDAYMNAVKIKATFSDAWYNMSLVFNKIGESDKAYIAYQKYLKLNQIKKQLSLQKQAVPPAKGKVVK